MKLISILAFMLAVGTASAQTAPAEGSLESQLGSRLGKATARVDREAKASEIVRGNITYSGIVVELLKTGSPLKVINQPAARDYKPSERYVTRDWSIGRGEGFTLLGIRF